MISSFATICCRGLLFLTLWFCCAGISQADGGRVLAEKTAGGYRVVLFGSPSPLRAGMADLSVFLEQAGKPSPVLDAVVYFRLNKLSRATPELAWRGSGCVAPGQAVAATQGHSGNKLLYSAMLGIPEPGLWELGVSISQDGKRVDLPFELSIERALPPVLTWWPVVALMPLGILVYLWRAYLLKKRRPL
ncbi:MAG: hypothetical protein ACKOEZ_13925 [Spartobacteria bacterium]